MSSAPTGQRSSARPDSTLSPTSAQRFAARTRARRWAGARPLVAAVAAVGVLVALAWITLASPLIGVREVRVEGTRTLTADQVRAAAGVTTGTPLARVDPGAVAAAVRAIPQVADVAVSRRLPGTLLVRVQERTPVAVLRVGQTLRLIDRTGVPYAATARAPAGLPVVLASADARPETVHAAATVVSTLPAALRARVASVAAPGPHAVTLVLTDGRRVVWGGVVESRKKALVLATLLQQPAAVYDVSAADAPTTRGVAPAARERRAGAPR